MAQGAKDPSILLVWDKHLLNARNPPRVTYRHLEYDEVADSNGSIIPFDDLTHRSFFFGPSEISALRQLIPPNLCNYSTFELLTACLWRCRTISLQPNPKEEMRLICIVNCRSKFNPPLPKGYYGNCIVFSVAVATAEESTNNPLSFGLDLISKAKDIVNKEYIRSVANLMVLKDRPPFNVVRSYLVNDQTKAGLGGIDFGWGKPVYIGPAKGVGFIPRVASLITVITNKKGEHGILVPVCLPAQAMDRFEKVLNGMLQHGTTTSKICTTSIKSVL